MHVMPLKPTSRVHYQDLHRALTQLMYRHDPLKLAAAGAPKDEYAPEVGSIIPRLKDANTPDDVRRIVHEEFVRGLMGNKPLVLSLPMPA
jgi:hypothetical protein